MENREAAKVVFGVASLVEALGGNPYRVRAYRRAARGLMLLGEKAADYVDGEGELALPWLGPRLRRKLGELVVNGRMEFQDELWAELPPPMRELMAVPGIGLKTADKLSRELGIKSVPDLVRAARRRKLQTLRGIGPKREAHLLEGAQGLVQTRLPEPDADRAA